MELTFSSAVVMSLAKAVNPALLRRCPDSLDMAHLVLDEMASRGNLVASHHKAELSLLETNLVQLATPLPTSASELIPPMPGPTGFLDVNGVIQQDSGLNQSPNSGASFPEWNSEDGMTGQQLMDMANNLDFGDLDTITSALFEPFEPFDRF